MNKLKLRETRIQKTARSTAFFLRPQPRNLENVTLVARRREHFWGFWAMFLVSQLPPKKVF